MIGSIPWRWNEKIDLKPEKVFGLHMVLPYPQRDHGSFKNVCHSTNETCVDHRTLKPPYVWRQWSTITNVTAHLI